MGEKPFWSRDRLVKHEFDCLNFFEVGLQHTKTRAELTRRRSWIFETNILRVSPVKVRSALTVDTHIKCLFQILETVDESNSARVLVGCFFSKC